MDPRRVSIILSLLHTYSWFLDETLVEDLAFWTFAALPGTAKYWLETLEFETRGADGWDWQDAYDDWSLGRFMKNPEIAAQHSAFMLDLGEWRIAA